MRIPNQIKLEREQGPINWVDRLNKFFQQVISALELIKAADEYVTISFAGTSDRVAIQREAKPADAVFLARMTDVDRPFDNVAVSGFHWIQEGSTISVQMSGLTAGRSYRGRFLIKREL